MAGYQMPQIPNTNPETDITQTTTYKQALTFYDAMYDESFTDEVDGKEFRLYKGYLTNLFTSVIGSLNTYSKIRGRLASLGCIQILEAGARNFPSVVVLVQHPADADWEASAGGPKPRKKDLTDTPEYARLLAEVEGIKKRLGGVDLAEALSNIERRLVKVEKELHKTTGGDNGT